MKKNGRLEESFNWRKGGGVDVLGRRYVGIGGKGSNW